MKNRNGFVSNSSSSSFIVAVYPNCPINFKEFLSYIDDSFGETKFFASGYEKVLKYVIEEWCCEEDEAIVETIKKQSGRTDAELVLFSLSNGDITGEALIMYLKDNGFLEIISND